MNKKAESKGTLLRKVMPDLFDDFGHFVEIGPGNRLNELLTDVEESMKKEGHEVSDVQKFVMQVIRQVAKDNGVPVMETLDMEEELIEEFYSMAKNQYDQGKYAQAQNLFRFLIMLNHFDYRFVFGLAACLQMEERHFVAATTYTMAATLRPHYPWPHIHASECYIAMGDLFSAAVSLKLSLDNMSDEPENEKLKENCLKTLVKIQGKLKAVEGKLQGS